MVSYVGSGPYCYANSLVMVLGDGAPAPAVVETLTGSAFGAELVGGTVPFFDPYGWTPELGLDAAIRSLGYHCERSAGGTAADAVARLRGACAAGPVLVGPADMGLLTYHPQPRPEGADHYVVALGVDGDTVLLHDPHGHPYATLSVADFVKSWRADEVTYTGEPYVMRSGFVRNLVIDEDEALRRVGARRLADAAACLHRLGMADAAAVATEQAHLVGALQHPLVTHADDEAEKLLRQLVPSYERLAAALTAG